MNQNQINTFRMKSRLPDSVINFLFNHRLKRVLRMIDYSIEKDYVGLDLGCCEGYLTQFLADRLRCTMIGADISKVDLRRAKWKTHYASDYQTKNPSASIDFVCCDMTRLPFKENSINFVICVSVLEHALKIKLVLKEIARSIVEKGVFVAGYPIETRFFNALLGIFMPTGLVIRDPQIMGQANFDMSPETHKQSFMTIRRLLQKYFFVEKKEKSFFSFLPDQLSWYETVRLIKVSSSKIE